MSGPKGIGMCGNNARFELDYRTGEFQIYGTGKMFNYRKGLAPWNMGCPCIKTVIINEGIENIGQYAFYNFDNLEKVTLPNSLKRINKGAFYNCTTLESIEIPDNVLHISAEAFRACEKLKSVKLPRKLRDIQFETFKSCSALRWIKLPPHLKEIDSRAFAYSGLEEITIPNCEIGTEAFYVCTNLKRAIISEGVTKIPYGTFNTCVNLIGVIIPETVTEIGGSAFHNCMDLQYVGLPNNAGLPRNIEFGEGAFYGCEKLNL